MPDRFSCFADLSKEMTEVTDFRIDAHEIPNSRYLIIAPHGGKIESGTSALTRAIAGEEFSYYCFEGLRQKDNRDLHITSHNFDEPRALEMANNVPTIIGIHGRQDANDDNSIYLGGLDTALITRLEESLSGSGFASRSDNHQFLATNPNNICNRGSSGQGAQLELPKTLRDELGDEDDDKMKRFASAVRRALIGDDTD